MNIERLYDIYRKVINNHPNAVLTSKDKEELASLLEQIIRKNKPSLLSEIKEIYEVVTLSSDGGCHPNPGKGNYAYIISGLPERIEHVNFVPETHTTNNRAEIWGIWRGLNALLPYKGQIKKLVINCDSKIALFGAGNIWKRSTNTDLFNKIDDVLTELEIKKQNIKWEWIPRNSTPDLEACHKMGDKFHHDNK